MKDDMARQRVEDILVAGLNRNSFGHNDLLWLDRHGIRFGHSYFACLAIDVDKQSIDRERYRNSDPALFQLHIRQFVQEMMDKRCNGFCFAYSDTEVVALVNVPDPDFSRSGLLEFAASICRQIKSISKLSVTVGVGRPVKGFESVPVSFGEASAALRYRLVEGGNQAIAYERIAKAAPSERATKTWSWEKLEQTINGGKTEEVDDQVEAAVSDLCALALSPDAVHRHVCKLLIHYYEMSEDLGITRKWLGFKDIRTLIVEACAISSKRELIEHCQQLFGRLALCIDAMRQSEERDPIQKAILYMKRNFSEPITLKKVADHVFLNTSYFSTRFKQKTGSTFVGQLAGIRIEEAKRKLLFLDEKITSIADMTGFANVRHFNRVFKSETGMTPKDFRDKHSRT